MNDAVPQEQPDWLKNHVPMPNAGNPNWRKGVSGNPKGRPPGKTAAQKVQAELNAGSLEIAKKLVESAKAGDMTAIGHVLARVVPALRSQSQLVQFTFDPELPIARQIEQVLAAVAAGELPADTGQQIISAIGTLSSARATEELEQRLTLLEAKAVNA